VSPSAVGPVVVGPVAVGPVAVGPSAVSPVVVGPAVQCVDVTRAYPTALLPALDGVDLSVEAGEWVAIMGTSGSGKSTLLNLIAGLDVPTAGSVLIDGETMSGASTTRRAELRRTHVGVVLQSINLLADLTAAQNVELPMRLAGTHRRQSRVRATALLDSFGLAHLVDRRPEDMSGGQQQRVAVARAMANQPTVLLADEPTGALDRTSANEVLDAFRAAHQGGQTLIVVTHDHRVASYADRIVTLEDGKVVD
jgi:putative ABC transport system ATP-binding protein